MAFLKDVEISRPDDRNGFDIVIGNPPYISSDTQRANPFLNEQRERLIKSNKYKSLSQKWDLYIPFIELGTQLNCENGITTMIVPFPLTNQLYAKVLRKMLVEEYDMFELVDLNGTKIFEGDILRWKGKEIAVIQYNERWHRFETVSDGWHWDLEDCRMHEIIGNIHDNPELLKGGAMDEN